MFQSMMQILNNLLKDDNDDGWLGAEPKGNEGNKMLNLLETLDTLVVKSLDFHISRGDMAHNSAELAISQSKLRTSGKINTIGHGYEITDLYCIFCNSVFKVKYYPSRSLDHIHFPLAADFHSAAGIHDIQGYYLNASRDVLLASINSTNIPGVLISHLDTSCLYLFGHTTNVFGICYALMRVFIYCRSYHYINRLVYDFQNGAKQKSYWVMLM